MIRRALGEFVHDALFYAEDSDLTRRAAAFLGEGLDVGERAVVVCRQEHEEPLLRALNNDKRVMTMTQQTVYRRAPDTIAQYQRFMESDEIAGGSRVRLVAEISFGEKIQTWQEWEKYEAAVNRCLAPYPIWAVCLYNTRELPQHVLRAGLLTHPHVSDSWRRRSNRHYMLPDQFLRTRAGSLSPFIGPGRTIQFDVVRDLAALRSAVANAATELGMPRTSIDDFVCAVNELAANATVHGQPPIGIKVTKNADQIVCDVIDQGDGFDDVFMGYAPVSQHRHADRGRGLWFVRQICDHLDYGQTDDGFVVRVAMDLPG